MDRLLIIADDFTGTLDTGVQFAKLGIDTQVVADYGTKFVDVAEATSVMVVNANSRHLEPKDAHDKVLKILSDYKKFFSHFYKKTDSALRGNIGAELSASVEATGFEKLSFVPAFPKMKRYVEDGILYIDGTPVEKSIFGTDLFNPVKKSAVRDIIGLQTDNLEKFEIFDAKTDEDLKNIAIGLKKENQKLLAGCAGFASALADVLDMPRKVISKPNFDKNLFVVSGSINDVSIKQLADAKSKGLIRHTLTPQQKCDENWSRSSEADELIKNCIEEVKTTGCSIVDVDRTGREEETDNLAKELNLSQEQLRHNIAYSLGYLFKEILDSNLEATYMCIGGDTLEAIIKITGIANLKPLCEIFAGVVMCEAFYNGKIRHIICKSGGFGQPELISAIIQMSKEK